MASFSKMVLVHAPAALVWSYIENPLQVVAISDRIVAVHDVRPSEVGGYNCTVVYDLQTGALEVEVETVEYIRNERLVTRTRRGVQTIQTWTLTALDGVTEVNVHMDYQFELPVVGWVAENIAVRLGEGDIENMLLRLKDNCEAIYRQQPGGSN